MMKKLLLSISALGILFTATSQNLIAHYSFDYDSLDASGNGYHLETFGTGLMHNFIGPSVEGTAALQLNGGQGYRTTNSLNNIGWQGTAVAFWIKNNNNVGTKFIIQSGTGFGVQLWSTTLKCFFDGTSAGSLYSNSHIDSTWKHVVCQNNGTTTSLYVDGFLEASMPETLYSQSNMVKFHIGVDYQGSYNARAIIDDLRVYDDTLSQQMINQLAGISTTGITTEEKQNEIVFFPNPATNFISIKGNVEDIERIEILDISGKVVSTFNYSTSKIDVSHLTNGCYFIKINTLSGIQTKKFIKE